MPTEYVTHVERQCTGVGKVRQTYINAEWHLGNGETRVKAVHLKHVSVVGPEFQPQEPIPPPVFVQVAPAPIPPPYLPRLQGIVFPPHDPVPPPNPPPGMLFPFADPLPAPPAPNDPPVDAGLGSDDNETQPCTPADDHVNDADIPVVTAHGTHWYAAGATHYAPVNGNVPVKHWYIETTTGNRWGAKCNRGQMISRLDLFLQLYPPTSTAHGFNYKFKTSAQ